MPDDLNAEDLEDLDADYALLRELEQKHMVSVTNVSFKIQHFLNQIPFETYEHMKI